jgi:hypothetical protein
LENCSERFTENEITVLKEAVQKLREIPVMPSVTTTVSSTSEIPEGMTIPVVSVDNTTTMDE